MKVNLILNRYSGTPLTLRLEIHRRTNKLKSLGGNDFAGVWTQGFLDLLDLLLWYHLKSPITQKLKLMGEINLVLYFYINIWTDIVNKCTNKTSICMIPKKKKTSNVKDLRPISFISLLYKSTEKVLAERLKEVLPLTMCRCRGCLCPRKADFGCHSYGLGEGGRLENI